MTFPPKPRQIISRKSYYSTSQIIPQLMIFGFNCHIAEKFGSKEYVFQNSKHSKNKILAEWQTTRPSLDGHISVNMKEKMIFCKMLLW